MNGQRRVVDLPNAQATRALGKALGEQLLAGSVLLLEGNLGSGKTTLVQGLGAGLRIDEIDSPTFTLINEYMSGRLPLYHIDLYRLSAEQADGMQLETYWDGQEVEPGIVAIEWSERLSYLPEHPVEVSLAYLPGEGRRAVVRLPEGMGFEFA
ncbi:MAG: tRNA (adenosine(37)-N6)-threonylcarbamoyltransferase complex ATPase subunit type 1 TsaE [Leptolyngbya foveolarum]|uniref:tRNA threonylcarbamoyladenosine biosynthesis protein TsaE n=1 Tax=Leptolyngbya foveolarum TaxID=47253 RepID=A0A2W4W4V5_9CYAN|nr:MAG: tRNA (adenosine(37)-N6)-threonylcarbamoyltransferase complex ATPase subunit type 1 TsaE [Leptolyngbya foveolarum]